MKIRKRARNMVVMAAVGATASYYWDPVSGESRRAKLREQVDGLVMRIGGGCRSDQPADDLGSDDLGSDSLLQQPVVGFETVETTTTVGLIVPPEAEAG
jgi:hypothetical protein